MTQSDPAASVQSASTSAQDVMKLFGDLRDGVLGIVKQAEAMAMCADAGRAGELARGHLVQAHGAIQESRLNLVIVGGEG